MDKTILIKVRETLQRLVDEMKRHSIVSIHNHKDGTTIQTDEFVRYIIKLDYMLAIVEPNQQYFVSAKKLKEVMLTANAAWKTVKNDKMRPTSRSSGIKRDIHI